MAEDVAPLIVTPPKSKGGRPAGAKDKKPRVAAPRKVPVAHDKALQVVLGKGLTPLAHLLKVMRTSNDPERRDKAAIAALPYIHKRLAPQEHTGSAAGIIGMGLKALIERAQEQASVSQLIRPGIAPPRPQLEVVQPLQDRGQERLGSAVQAERGPASTF